MCKIGERGRKAKIYRKKIVYKWMKKAVIARLQNVLSWCFLQIEMQRLKLKWAYVCECCINENYAKIWYSDIIVSGWCAISIFILSYVRSRYRKFQCWAWSAAGFVFFQLFFSISDYLHRFEIELLFSLWVFYYSS